MKNQPTRKLRAIASCGVLFALTQSTPVEWAISQLSQSQAFSLPPYLDPQTLKERNERARKLLELWQQRNQRDVTAEVVPYTQDADESIQISAIRVLTRLETAEAERVLADLERATKQAGPEKSRLHTGLLRVLARIRSRNLKGSERLEAFAKGAGYSFDQIVLFSQKVNVHQRSDWEGTPENAIVAETIDLLCMMGRNGENIQPFVQRLTLTPAQKIQLQSASMPEAEASQFIIDYLSQLKVDTGDDDRLWRYVIVEMNATATPPLIRKLEVMLNQRFWQGQIGYVTLFRAAMLSGDPRVPALLKQFAASTDPDVRSFANQSLLRAEEKNYYPPLP